MDAYSVKIPRENGGGFDESESLESPLVGVIE
jgi:hypothetical protein